MNVLNLDKIQPFRLKKGAITLKMGRNARKPVWGFANNAGADQPAHMRSLISAFVFRFLQSNMCKLATGEILIFWLVSKAEKTDLSLV